MKQGIRSNHPISVDLCVKVPKIDDPLRRGFASARREKLVPIFRRFGSQREGIGIFRCERGSTERNSTTNTGRAQAFG